MVQDYAKFFSKLTFDIDFSEEDLKEEIPHVSNFRVIPKHLHVKN
jgi:hypothetical protein